MEEFKFVSVVMPIRNEADSIEDTIQSLLKQDYPADRFEILIADGISIDGTEKIVRNFAENNSKIKYIRNYGKIVPTGLNLAIEKSIGEVILRMDAHSYYPDNYISKLVLALEEYQADNVGCVIETIPANNSPMARAIAAGLSSPFGVGNSMFRVGVNKPMEVDTVPFGCFRREVFDKIGLFDEELVRNQDDEFNARMIKNGLRIVLIPDLECRYQARSNFRMLARMLYQYGLFKPLVNMKLKQVATLRQLVPLLLVIYSIGGGVFSFIWPSLLPLYILGLGTYISFIILGGIKAYTSNKDLKLFPFSVITFPIMHLSYGWGYLQGIGRLLFRSKRNQKEVKLSR